MRWIFESREPARSFEPLTKSWTFLKCSYSLSFHSWVLWEVIIFFYFSALPDLFNSYSTNSQLLKYKWSFQKLNSPRTNVHSIAQSTYIGPEKELLFQRLRKVKYLLWKYCTAICFNIYLMFSVCKNFLKHISGLKSLAPPYYIFFKPIRNNFSVSDPIFWETSWIRMRMKYVVPDPRR